MTRGGGQVGGEGEEGGATALRTERPECAACVDTGSRTTPRRGRDFRQGQRLEQTAQGRPVDHLGALATAPWHSVVERSRIAFSMKIFLETAPVEAELC